MSDTTFLISGGFFDAVDSDRLYSADQMNQPYKKLIHDGINREADGTTPGFAVTAGGGMNVLVATGNAMIGGKWAENKAVQTIAVAGNTSGSARIDSIILQCDKSRAVRAVQIVYRQGTTAAPNLVSDDDITELRLANIRVPSAASSIASENITDTRGGAECPWVRSVFDAPDARYIVEEYSESELAGAYQTVKSAVDSIRYAAQSGQPTVALQASDMIDSNLVYLYQGSETGYSTGYLYYYSDAAGAWIRGAQYGASVVDTALDEDSENPVQNKAIAVAIKTVRSFVVEVPGSAAAFSGSIAAGDFAKALATYTAGSGVYAVKDGEVYQLSAASSSTMTFTQMYHGTMNFIKQIQITSADTFTVTNTALSSSAADTSYNNTTSGLTATDVQAAIDENAVAIDGVNGRLQQVEGSLGSLVADSVTFSKETNKPSGYIRTDGTFGNSSFSNIYKFNVAGYVGKTLKIETVRTHNSEYPLLAFYSRTYGTTGESIGPQYLVSAVTAESANYNAEIVVPEGAKTMCVVADISAEAYPTCVYREMYDVGEMSEALNAIEKDVVATSQNVLDPSTITPDTYINNNGSTGSSEYYAVTDYIEVNEGDIVVCNTGKTGNVSLRYVAAYDSAKSILSASGADTVASYTVPEGVKFVRISAVKRSLTSPTCRINLSGADKKYTSFFNGPVNDLASANQYDVQILKNYPITTLSPHLVNILSYRPLGPLTKGYICLVTDDGDAELATYTIPMLQSKGNVPCTFAVMKVSTVFGSQSGIDAVVDAVNNHGCEIAQHGGTTWDQYDEFTLNNFFDDEKTYWDSLGLTAYGAVCPEHKVSNLIRAICGGRFGCLRTGYSNGAPYYLNYTNGPRSNIFGLTSQSSLDGTLGSQKEILDYVKANNLLRIIHWHENELTAEKKAQLEGIIDYAKEIGLTFVTMKDIPTII